MRELKLLTGQRVIVVTPATALDGVVESCTRTVLTLVDSAAVDGPTPIPVDGAVLIPVAQISYVQVPS